MYIVRMPRLGITMESGKVGNWLCELGASIEAGKPLFEMETDKSIVEIEAQAGGILRKLLVEIGQEVAVNTPIAVIAEADEEIDLSRVDDLPAESVEGKNQATDAALHGVSATQVGTTVPPVRVSPRMRKLATDLGVDLALLAGQEITEDRIKALAAGSADSDAFIELSHIQRAMKVHIGNSWSSIPHFVQIVSVDMSKVLQLRGQLGAAGLNDILVKIVGDTAVRHPLVNGRLEGVRVRINRRANVSLAVATPKGLVVPVIRNVDALSVGAVNAAIAGLAAKARASGLEPSDTDGGTITFSNLGAYGIETGTPVINGPQATLVFAGAIIKTLVVGADDAIRIAPIMKLSIAFDHRFIDGMTAAAFTSELKARIETLDPASLG